MEKRLIFISVILLAGLASVIFLIGKDSRSNNTNIVADNHNQATSSPQAGFTIGGKPPANNAANTASTAVSGVKPGDVVFPVPYINEAPSGIFAGPWKNACEEASMTMLEAFYTGKKSVTVNEAESFMTALFGKEDVLFGQDVNEDTYQTATIINNFTSYKAVIKDYPTVQDIKSEIDHGHPVLAPVFGFDLHNPNIPFAPHGSYYHMEVIIGYNDASQEFITNDSGDIKNGAGHRYNYDLFMNAVRDYDYVTNKVDGPMRVVFTSPK